MQPAPAIDLTKHQGLVWMVVKRYLRVIQGTDCLEAEDLVQAGNMGMMRAAETFDPSKAKFSTYAALWMKAYIRREIQDRMRTVRVPVHRQDSGGSLTVHPKRNQKLFVKRMGGKHNDADVCLVDLMTDRFAPDPTAEEGLLIQERNALANRIALEHLDDRERYVIRCRYWEDKTLREVGDVLGLSRERVRQIQTEALRKMRKVASFENA